MIFQRNFRSYLKNQQDLGQKIILLIGITLLLLICVYPLANLFLKALFPKGEFSLRYFEAILNHKGTLKAFQNSIFVSLAVATLSIVIALPLAWLFSRTDLPYKNKFRSWFCLPYAIPPYIGAMAWIYLANPQNGYLNQLSGSAFFNIYSYFGLIWVETTFLYTFVLLSSLSFLDRIDPSLEEAARLSGAGPLKVFVKITLPLMRSSLLSSFVLVMLATLASFGVPALIGSPARISMMTTQIYTFQKMGSMNGIFQAVALSALLLLISFFLLYIQEYLSRNKSFQMVSGKAKQLSLVELKRLKTPFLLFTFFSLFVLFILPILALALMAFTQNSTSLKAIEFSLIHFNNVFFKMDETYRAMGNSFFVAAMAATLATSFAVVLSFFKTKTRLKGRKWLEVLSSLPYSTPGTVVALALILSFSRNFLFVFPSLYNTLAILWLAYLVKYLSLSMKTLSDGYSQIDNSLAEAARVSGANGGQTFFRIWLPLLKPSLIASWFLVFMPALSELTMTLLLTGPGIETLGTLIFQMQEYADPTGGSSALLALTIVMIVIMINFLVKKLSQGRYGL